MPARRASPTTGCGANARTDTSGMLALLQWGVYFDNATQATVGGVPPDVTFGFFGNASSGACAFETAGFLPPRDAGSCLGAEVVAHKAVNLSVVPEGMDFRDHEPKYTIGAHGLAAFAAPVAEALDLTLFAVWETTSEL